MARRTIWRRPILVGVLALVVLGVAYIGATFVQVWWTARSDDRGPVDAIVVLGAAQYDGAPSPVLRARLDRAVELFLQGEAPLIVVTGGRQEGDRFTQAQAGYRYLRDRGVPDEALLLEVDGTSTYTELKATARILDARGLSSVLMVSDGYHSARLLAIAGEVGLDGRVAPTGTTFGMSELTRETAAVALGRVVSFRRLDAFS